MINGLGVLGWGVGGIEAEAAMLGQPLYMLTPQVVGFKLTGRLREGVTATDLVLTVTQMLRKKGVVEKFVEFYGPGLGGHEPGRPRHHREHGARSTAPPAASSPWTARRSPTCGAPGARTDLVDLVERYCKEQGLFRTDGHGRIPSSPTPSPSTSTPWSRAWPAPSARRTACPCRR